MEEQPIADSVTMTRQAAVVDSIREQIMSGKLEAGDRLQEVSLSELLQVSRTPIREALIVLAEEGLVQYRPNRGYVVRSFTLPFILNAYIVRETLEGLACRLAAERGVDAHLRRAMEQCLQEGDEILSGDRLKAKAREPWRLNNKRLHELIFEAAANEPLKQALSSATKIPYSSSRVVHWFVESDVEGLYRLRAVQAEHHAIVRAICNGEGYRAETAMRSHIAFAAEFIRNKYSPPEMKSQPLLPHPVLVSTSKPAPKQRSAKKSNGGFKTLKKG